MKKEVYTVTVKHDSGRSKLTVTVLQPLDEFNGKERAIQQVMGAEMCPRSAILSAKLIKTKKS